MGRSKQGKALTLPKGVQIRGENLRINFTLYGQRHFIPLNDHFANQFDLDSADATLKKIRRDIKMNNFEWSTHFPWHPNAKSEIKTGDKLTVSELLDDYLKDFAKDRRAITTFDNYSYRSERFLKPAFGNILVSYLTSGHISQWALKMGNKGIMNKTLQSYIAPLSSAYTYAKKHGIITKNPFNDFEWPEETEEVQKKRKERQKQKKLDIFIFEELSALCSGAKHEQDRNIIQFGFWTGLRPEELFALQWSDIDWQTNKVNVSKAKIYRRGYKVLDYEPLEREIIKGIKTGELGERDVRLMPPAIDALQRQKQWTLTVNKFIFHNPYWNRAWTGTNQFRNRFEQACHQSGVRYRRPYMMRHTYASMMLKKGEDIEFVANQMGHVNTDMIRKVYAHFIPDNKEGGYELRGDWAIDFSKFSKNTFNS